MTYTEMKEWYKNNEELCLRLGQYHLDWLNEQAEKLEKIEAIEYLDNEYNIKVMDIIDPSQKPSVDWDGITTVATGGLRVSDASRIIAQAILKIKGDIDDIKHDIKMM